MASREKLSADSGKEEKKTLERECRELKGEIAELMRQIRLKDFQVAKIVDRLKELAQQVKKGMSEVQRLRDGAEKAPQGNQAPAAPHAQER